jgi:hypothetical protein
VRRGRDLSLNYIWGSVGYERGIIRAYLMEKGRGKIRERKGKGIEVKSKAVSVRDMQRWAQSAEALKR